MNNTNNLTNNLEGHGGFATILHSSQFVSPSSFIIRHSGFDTVPQQQKQRWLETRVVQRSLSTPWTRGKNTQGVSKSSSRREEGKSSLLCTKQQFKGIAI